MEGLNIANTEEKDIYYYGNILHYCIIFFYITVAVFFHLRKSTKALEKEWPVESYEEPSANQPIYLGLLPT